MSIRLVGALSVAVCLCTASVHAQSELPSERVRATATVQSGRTSLALGESLFRTTQRPVEGLREVELDGATVRVLLWNERISETSVEPWYAISLDGETVTRAREARHVLELEVGAFDPLEPGETGETGAPEVPEELRASPTSDVRLVQFVTQPLEAYVEGLASHGARALAFVAGQGYVVHAPAEARAALEGVPYVRWVGAYHPAYRVEPFLREALASESEQLLPSRAYNVLLFEQGDDVKAEVAQRVLALGGSLRNAFPGGRLLEVGLSPEQLVTVASWDEVLFIDRWSEPEDDMDLAMELSGGNYYHNVLGMTGTGVRGEVMDSGVRQTHNDFTPAPLIHGGAPDLSQHGTNTYGIVFGDGNTCIGGALPDGTGIFADSSKLLTSRYNHTGELVNPLGPYQAVFQSNSWGNTRTVSYNSISADMDDLLFDHDILIFQSQSNSGGQLSRPQAWAKNIMAVGGIRHLNTLSTADDSWTGGASIGPASDGRIKPDLAHHYDSIATTDSGADNDCRTSFCCTSAATPVTAGNSALFYELWHSGVFGNVPGPTVFLSRPHMSLAKAMLICNADQWTFSGATHDLTRVHQGWGRVNVKNIYDRRFKTFWVNETDVLAPLETTTYELTVDLGEPLLRFVMVYADPAGNPGVQSQHRINDIDLKVTAPNMKVYWGNNGLLSSMVSTPDGSADDKNTVETIIVQNPQAGIWTVEITASEVNLDGHMETPALDVDYALAVVGVQTAGQQSTFCDGGDGSLASCPCANPGTPDEGCDNSAGTGGVHAEVVTFDAALPQATIMCTGYPPAGFPAGVLIRSTALAASPVPFGDGLRCVNAPVVRIGASIAFGGSSTHTFGHGAGPGLFHSVERRERALALRFRGGGAIDCRGTVVGAGLTRPGPAARLSCGAPLGRRPSTGRTTRWQRNGRLHEPSQASRSGSCSAASHRRACRARTTRRSCGSGASATATQR